MFCQKETVATPCACFHRSVYSVLFHFLVFQERLKSGDFKILATDEHFKNSIVLARKHMFVCVPSDRPAAWGAETPCAGHRGEVYEEGVTLPIFFHKVEMKH